VEFSKKAFEKKVNINKTKMKRFLKRLENNKTKGLDFIAEKLEPEVWKEIDCLACANCCKTMSPTYTKEDITRISAHLQMTPAAFKEKWLYKADDGDWMNVKQPCQFLGSDNMCSIYEVRPYDCASFPHLTKKRMLQYVHVHEQNITYCPATYSLVEKMQVALAQ
jgi:uncharacterized protein